MNDSSGKSRFLVGTKGAGPKCCAGKYDLNASKRAPKLRVSRFIVHLSCAKMPKSYLMRLRIKYGAAVSVSWLGTPLLNRYCRPVVPGVVRSSFDAHISVKPI